MQHVGADRRRNDFAICNGFRHLVKVFSTYAANVVDLYFLSAFSYDVDRIVSIAIKSGDDLRYDVHEYGFQSTLTEELSDEAASDVAGAEL